MANRITAVCDPLRGGFHLWLTSTPLGTSDVWNGGQGACSAPPIENDRDYQIRAHLDPATGCLLGLTSDEGRGGLPLNSQVDLGDWSELTAPGVYTLTSQDVTLQWRRQSYRSESDDDFEDEDDQDQDGLEEGVSEGRTRPPWARIIQDGEALWLWFPSPPPTDAELALPVTRGSQPWMRKVAGALGLNFWFGKPKRYERSSSLARCRPGLAGVRIPVHLLPVSSSYEELAIDWDDFKC